MNDLEFIIERIENGLLLPASMLRLSTDRALEQRGKSRFAKPWRRLQAEVERAIYEAGLPLRIRNDLATLREVAFIRVYDFTEHVDLAGTVSDDFGLFGGALLTSLNDAWLNGLWCEYRQGRFPCNNVRSVEGSLHDLLYEEPEPERAWVRGS